MLKEGHQKIKQVIFKNVYLSNIQLKQLTVKILFKVIFEKLVYVWYAFCQFFSYNQMEATKELVWLECLLSSIFVMENWKIFFCDLSFTLYHSKVVVHENDIYQYRVPVGMLF